MNIESTGISAGTKTVSTKTSVSNTSTVSFSDNLNDLKKQEDPDTTTQEEKLAETKSEDKTPVKESQETATVDEAIDDLNSVLNELTQSDEKDSNSLKSGKKQTDKLIEGEILINNNYNVDSKDALPQMNPNMNFGGDGQPFSSFMNDSSNGNNGLSSSSGDLAEEAAILSTMAENIAMVNKIQYASDSEAVVMRNDGIKNVDTNTGIIKETILKFDSVIMNQADVEFFANLVNNGEFNLNGMSAESLQKSMGVSKTLADMLAKSMQENRPVRIEFDNGISVIIKISREGKLTADFLPSTQVAEAYLKENLPLLKQRFEEQNLEYDELNQRERRNKEQEQQRKKGQDNE